jgi:hypothetical protein
MADETRASFKHTVAKKALAPIVTSAATAITAYLMRKAAEMWEERVQPKLEEKGGAEAVARQAAETPSEKPAPVSDTLASKAGPETDAPSGDKSEPTADDDRAKERRKREQRRRQRRKALEQSGSS